jgi:O-antigen/teichoic acid export membrane protein
MFRALATNTLISAVAYFFVSIVGLLLVPVLLDAYGLELFGLLLLARLFLPVSGLAIFDFGFSEVSTQAVARARETGDWSTASGQVTLLVLGAFSVGSLACCCGLPCLSCLSCSR